MAMIQPRKAISLWILCLSLTLFFFQTPLLPAEKEKTTQPQSDTKKETKDSKEIKPPTKTTPTSASKLAAVNTALGTGFTLVQDHFQLGEVNLSQGSLELTETDLVLPGKNGLDVVLARKYSSAYFDQERLGFRDGWALTFDMTLFSDDIDGHAFIINADGAKEYKWWGSRGALSRQVSDFSCIKEHWNSGTSGEWKLYAEDGKIYTFTFWSLNSSAQLAYLTAIEDTHGNKITIVRENGPNNNKRIQKIIDTFGREIKFFYESQNGNLITKISYKNNLSADQSIVYRYDFSKDANGYLVGVKVGNLPEKTYDYITNSNVVKNISTDLNQFQFILDSTYTKSNGTQLSAYTTRYDYSSECQSSLSDSGDYQSQAESFYKNSLNLRIYPRYLLAAINNPLGSKVEYEYGDSRGKDRSIAVTAKVISSDGNSLRYTFTYPRGSDPHISGTWFSQSKFSGKVRNSETILESYDIFAYSSATVTYPLAITPETYSFDQGVLIRKTQGIYTTETTWDFNKMVPTQVTSKKNGVIQSASRTLYDNFNNPTQVISQKGSVDYIKQETTYYTDSAYINKNILHLPKTTSVTDLNTGVKRSSFATFTDKGKPFEAFEGQDSSGKKLTTLTYDSVGRIVSQTQYGPGGNVVVQYGYTLTGTTYTLTQSLNGKTSTSVYETNTGSLKSSTDPNGNTTTYTYDDYGRPTQITYPNGQTAQTTYSADLKTTTLTQGGRTVITTTDSLGRTLQVTYPSGEDNIKYEYFYGSLPSKLFKQPAGSGAWVQKKSYTYDAYLRKLTSTSTDFGTTSYSYDDANNKVTVTDPLGRSTTQTSDQLGRQISQVFNPDNSTTTSTYDGFNNPLTTTDPRLNTRKADYDAYGRITNTYHPYNTGTPKLRSTTVYKSNPGFIDYVQVYDEQGNAFRKYGYVYDSENRLKNTLLNNVIKETLSYDESSQTNSKGALTTAENDDSKTQYSYDTMGRLQKTTTTIKAINKTYSIQQGYNPTNGNLATLTYPDNKQVTYTYDSHQRVQTMAYNGTTLCTYAYNPNGTLASLTYGNGITLTYTYTKDVLLTTLTAKQGGSTLYTQSYTYDTLGKMTNTTHSDYFNYGPNLTRDYTYTPKDELKTVAINNTNTYTHNYDKTGNTLRFETPHNKNLGADNITVSTTKDQLTEKRQKDGRKTTFSYDPEGNMTQKNRINIGGSSGDTLQYTYNYQGQLQAINKNGYSLATYAYDHNNQRVYSYHTQDPFPQKFYYWANGQIIGEGVIDTQNASNNTDFSVRYFYSGNQKIAMERRDMSTGQTSLYYFINNAQGTPVLILDSSGSTRSRINLDEWGNLGMLQGPSQEVNYTGKKLDVSTGLYYFNQRYYDPEIGRFLQEDPAGQGLNPYRYCGNNPLMFTDPDGRIFGWDDALIAVVSYLAAEGAKAALFNASVQWLTHSCDSKKINWDSVGESFTKGAIGGAIGEMQWVQPGGSDLASYTMAGAANGAINGGLINMTYGSVSGKNMSLENAWNQFSDGVGPGAIAGTCKGIYKHQTGFSKVDSGPGLNGPDPYKFLANPKIGAVENANNIWFPIGEDSTSLVKNIFREGGLISSGMNYLIPGANAVAGLHDWWGAMYGWTNGGYGLGTVLSLAAAIPLTYSALSSPGKY